MIAKVNITKLAQNSWFGFHPKTFTLAYSLWKSWDKSIFLFGKHLSSTQCVGGDDGQGRVSTSLCCHCCCCCCYTLCSQTYPSSYFLLQGTDEPPASEGSKRALSLDKNTAAALPQASGEETPLGVPPVDSTIQHSSPNVVRKVLKEPVFPDHMGPTASQDPRHLEEEDKVGGGASLFHPWTLHSPDSCLLP